MKKVIFTVFMVFGLVFSGLAQKNLKNAIGLRLGNNDGFGGEASYQRNFSKNNRLELDLGIRNQTYANRGYYYDSNAVKFVALYQWVFHIDGGFNWYAGVGGGFGTYNNRLNNDYPNNGSFGLVAGDIGVEYVFKFPLQVFIDGRPELGFGDYKYTNSGLNTFGPDIAIGARFRF